MKSGSVKLTVWANTLTDKQGKEFEVLSFKYNRSYKDKDGVWKDTDGFRFQDLADLESLARKAREYARENPATQEPE